MTANEFEQAYAERSGWEHCEGWQSISEDLAADPLIRRQAGLA
jgi:hypothetical protein